jgi:hypothetical protein
VPAFLYSSLAAAFIGSCGGEKGELDPRTIAEQLFAPARTKDKHKSNFSNRSRYRAMQLGDE